LPLVSRAWISHLSSTHNTTAQALAARRGHLLGGGDGIDLW
jgi:hypothetical protein